MTITGMMYLSLDHAKEGIFFEKDLNKTVQVTE